MNGIKLILASTLVLVMVSGCSQRVPIGTAAAGHHGETPHWGYTGETGPENWADLSPEWIIARDGKEQSPINIARATEADLPPIKFDYNPSKIKIINNGHSIQVNYDKGSSIQVGGETYQLNQFHFHAPSEHTISGQSYEMEMHLVHKSDEDRLAVVGVMIEKGSTNREIEPVWKHLTSEQGEEQSYNDEVNVSNLLPANRTYYTYPGSLTTPPCSEGVLWLVLTEPIELSSEQLAAFTSIYSGNNRPVQPLKGRKILKSR